MKQFFIILLSLILIGSASGKTTYFGQYHTSVYQGMDSIVSTCPVTEYRIAGGKVMMTVMHEVVSDEKISNLKTFNRIQIMSAISMGLSAISMGVAYSSYRPGSTLSYLQSVCNYKSAENTLYVAALNASNLENMYISIVFENRSDDEISINDRKTGQMFYVSPNEKIVFNSLNYAIRDLRIEYNLSNTSSIEKETVYVMADAKCLEATEEFRNDDVLLVSNQFPKRELGTALDFKYATKDYLDINEELYTYYSKIDLKTYEKTILTLSEFKKLKAELKRK